MFPLQARARMAAFLAVAVLGATYQIFTSPPGMGAAAPWTTSQLH